MITRQDVMTSARHAGDVQRYHTWPTLQTQTVAHHTWNVVRIYMELFGDPSPVDLRYMMRHDLGELGVGDLPYPVKKNNSVLADECAQEEQRVLQSMFIDHDMSSRSTDIRIFQIKLCDLLEMLEFCTQEVILGNNYARQLIVDISADVTSRLDSASSGTRDVVLGHMRHQKELRWHAEITRSEDR